MNPSRRAAVVAYLALGVVWGMNFMFMRLAAPLIPAAQTTLLRLAFGTVPVLLFALGTRSLRWWHLRRVHHFAVQAVLASGFYYYAYAAGTYRLDSSVAGALSGSIPLFASIAAIVVFRTEPVTTRKVLAVIFGALGVAALARPWATDQVDLAGVLWMLAGSASLGASFGYTRRFISPLGIPATAAATYQMVLATLGLAAVTDLTGITAIAKHPLALTGVVVGLGVVGTGLAFVCYYLAVGGLGALTASTATYIAPVVAMGIGVRILYEPLDPTAIGAVVLILAAASVSQLPSRTSPARTHEAFPASAHAAHRPMTPTRR